MSESAFVTPREVEFVPALGYTRACALLGKYAGGDDIQFCRPVMTIGLPPDNIPLDLRKQIVADARRVHEMYAGVPEGGVVVRVPPSLDFGDDTGSALTWDAKFSILSQVYGCEGEEVNVMCQGFLFAEVVNEPGRLGCSRWPFVGLYDCVGVSGGSDTELRPPAAPSSVGINCLHPSDQHVHLVDEYGGLWHIGSDMSRCVVDGGFGVAKCWAVCFDPETLRCEVSLWLIVASGEAETAADAVGAACGDGMDVGALVDALPALLGPHGVTPFMPEIEALLRRKQSSAATAAPP